MAYTRYPLVIEETPVSKIHERLKVKVPIWSAGMGLGISGSALTSAVSNAGGLGVLGLGGMQLEMMRTVIADTRQKTSRAFGVNIIMPLMLHGQIELCFDEQIPLLVLFWGDPSDYIKDAHKRGMLVVSQCGDVEEAVRAAEAGVDGVIVQGTEAGGHVKATRPLEEVVRDTVAELASLPVIASGGIATGAHIARSLSWGASAVSMGTRFLATHESSALDGYKQRLLDARSEDTVLTKLFDVGWPNAAHRVIRNRAYSDWEAAGCPASGDRPGEHSGVGTLTIGEAPSEVPHYSVTPPLLQFDGDLEEMALYCGESCDHIDTVLSADHVMEQLISELREAQS
jgi:nitronate monooxygenase